MTGPFSTCGSLTRMVRASRGDSLTVFSLCPIVVSLTPLPCGQDVVALRNKARRRTDVRWHDLEENTIAAVVRLSCQDGAPWLAIEVTPP